MPPPDKATRQDKMRHNTTSVDRKHLEEPSLCDHQLCVCVHYCLRPLAVSINEQPSSLSAYLTLSVNHPSFQLCHEMFFRLPPSSISLALQLSIISFHFIESLVMSL